MAMQNYDFDSVSLLPFYVILIKSYIAKTKPWKKNKNKNPNGRTPVTIYLQREKKAGVGGTPTGLLMLIRQRAFCL